MGASISIRSTAVTIIDLTRIAGATDMKSRFLVGATTLTAVALTIGGTAIAQRAAGRL
jgi:hypothetical protein